MSKKKAYKTVEKPARIEIVEKKSRFIASVIPAKTEEEALKFLSARRSEFPDATHNVYAYVIDENNIFRYSDDGEPGGTAGMPVLDAIRKTELVDVAVVVTRYFGGTLLGTGGLVRAYGMSAKQGIEAAGIVTRTLCDCLEIKCPYTLTGKLQYLISSLGCICDDTIYADDVTFKIYVPTDETDSLTAKITEATNAGAEYRVTDQKYINIP